MSENLGTSSALQYRTLGSAETTLYVPDSTLAAAPGASLSPLRALFLQQTRNAFLLIQVRCSCPLGKHTISTVEAQIWGHRSEQHGPSFSFGDSEAQLGLSCSMALAQDPRAWGRGGERHSLHLPADISSMRTWEPVCDIHYPSAARGSWRSALTMVSWRVPKSSQKISCSTAQRSAPEGL